ncbi:LLM class flavin-dependent oxidoreductase [Nocardia sp. CA-136227]|uniref:LLM class flavin-dependent oxidoreductase n=1 Tax=Nocardia sp. CA-136227 TaxID=3239979 RepID=UPI003D97EF15
MVEAQLRFTFALPDPQPTAQAEIFRTALEMARWGDSHGINAISLDEHHASGFGWSANPILEAGMIMAATERIRVIISAALGPLYDPVRLAEDIAVVDQVGGGRMTVILGLGYRPIEYAALGKDFRRRGRLMDELLDTLLTAWRGDPVERGGERVEITPRPISPPERLIMVGGSAEATARRAVRFGLPLQLSDYLPDLMAYYRNLCAEAGIKPRVHMVAEHRPGMVFVHEDPDKAWAELGEHIMWEAVEYGAWAAPDMRSVMHVRGVTGIEEVKASGRYRVVTPDQLIDELVTGGPRAAVTLHPLIGGMPLDEAWKSVHLLTDNVLPEVRRRLESATTANESTSSK